MLRMASCLGIVLTGCVSVDHETPTETFLELVRRRAAVTPFTPAERRGPLTRDDAIHLALGQNLKLREELALITIKAAGLAEAKAPPAPDLLVAIGIPVDGGGGSPMLNQFLQLLNWFWERPTAVRAAAAELEAQVLRSAHRALEVRTQAQTLHTELVYRCRRLALTRESAARIAQLESLAELDYEAGVVGRAGVNRARAVKVQAETRAAIEAEQLELARREFLEHIGIAAGSIDFEIPQRFESQLLSNDPLFGLSEFDLVQLTIAKRLDTRASFARLSAHEARRALARLARLPSLKLGVVHQKNFQNRDAVFPAVNLSPPLWGLGKIREVRSESELERELWRAEQVLERAIREARSAYASCTIAYDTLSRVRREQVVAIRDNHERTRQEYASGLVSQRALIEAELEWIETELGELEAERRVIDCVIAVEAAVGMRIREFALEPSLAERRRHD